jgi:hypothetical protein
LAEFIGTNEILGGLAEREREKEKEGEARLLLIASDENKNYIPRDYCILDSSARFASPTKKSNFFLQNRKAHSKNNSEKNPARV